MKITAIIGTNRRNGNVERICKRIIEGAEKNGHESEIINLFDYKINECRGCWACVKLKRCIIEDDFAAIYKKIEKTDCIILGAPSYWGNVPGIMKNFFDRHTGYAMYKPENAAKFHELKTFDKFKVIRKEMKNFGPVQSMRNKKIIFVTALTAPFPVSHISGDLPVTLKAMKIYAKKLKCKIVGKVVYTDTLLKIRKNKEKKIMKNAYKLGEKLS